MAPDDVEAFADALADLLRDGAGYDARAEAALSAGRDLPDWADTARAAGGVLDRI